MPPFFSIIVPVYNHEGYIGEALDSLLAQTDPDWEACVVDDGSMDRTPDIVDEYARRDSRIRVVHQANGGQAVALNAGLRMARGEWVCWLSSDDLFVARKLAVHHRWIERYPGHRYFFSKFQVLNDATGLVSSSDQGPIPAREWQVIDLLSRNYINGISLCIHREAFQEVGEFDSLNRYGQDYDLHLRMLSRFEAVPIPEETCISRVHAGQFSRLENRSMFYDCASAAVRFLVRTSFPNLFPWVDFQDEKQALAAVDRALDVATSPDAYVNQLGPHPLLLSRIVEWVWAQTGHSGRQMRALVEWRVLAMANRCQSCARWGCFWRAAALWVAINPANPLVVPFTASDIADAALADLGLRGDAEAEAVKRFIEKRQGREPHQLPPRREGAQEVLVDGSVGEVIVQKLAQIGWRVTRLDSKADGLRLHEWGWTVGVHSARRSVVASLAAVPVWSVALISGQAGPFLAIGSKTSPVKINKGEGGDLGGRLDQAERVGWAVRGMRRLLWLQWRAQRLLTIC